MGLSLKAGNKLDKNINKELTLLLLVVDQICFMGFFLVRLKKVILWIKEKDLRIEGIKYHLGCESLRDFMGLRNKWLGIRLVSFL